MERLYTVSKNKMGAGCDTDHELLITKFTCDLNQIPYDYLTEVAKRFKGLDLINRVPEELWTEISNVVQQAVTTPRKKRNARGSMAV